jgi:uncharacterized protein (TIGR00730 family)
VAIRRICVFCGASTGSRPAYAEAAGALGRTLAARGLGLVYGGGSIGLMGVVADAALAAGGEAIGVLPRGLASREFAHAGLTQLHLVGSMHERKALMARLSDAFVALPGGLGTLEETFEVLTWAQLGIHRKPVALLNVDGYWDGLLALLGHARSEGFLRPEAAGLLLSAPTPASLLDTLATWAPDPAPRVWLDETAT